jgi:hypothetical protein
MINLFLFSFKLSKSDMLSEKYETSAPEIKAEKTNKINIKQKTKRFSKCRTSIFN